MKKQESRDEPKKPPKPYDQVMKDIFDPITEPFAKSILGLDFETVERLPENLRFFTERETDYGIIALNSKGEKEIYHFEFQVIDSVEIQKRELIYYSLYNYHFTHPINQFLIYLGEKPPQYINKPLPIVYNDPHTGERICNNLHFFTVIYLKDISYKKLLEANQWQLVILSILGNYENSTIDKMTEDIILRLQKVAKNKTELKKSIERIRILSNLRPKIATILLQKTKNMIGFKIDRTIDPWYREGHEIGVSEGIERGIEKGIEKGEKFNKVKTALKLFKLGMETSEIKEVTELSELDMKIVKAFYEQFGLEAINHLTITDKEIKVK